MRHFLLALLIALLPIRGWVGNAMAVNMVSHGVASQAGAAAALEALECMEHSPAVHAATHAPTPDTGDAGHGIHHTAQDDGASAEPPHAPQHASTHPPDHIDKHAACEVCNGPGMALAWASAPLPSPPHGLVVASAVRFDSTVLPQGIKPPIS